jgi:transcriptional regulator with XRE-family HTH domain
MVITLYCPSETMPKNKALKIAIIESELTQFEVAEAIDVHETRMSQIVNGRREPSEVERKAIARILKRKATDLFPEATAP